MKVVFQNQLLHEAPVLLLIQIQYLQKQIALLEKKLQGQERALVEKEAFANALAIDLENAITQFQSLNQ